MTGLVVFCKIHPQRCIVIIFVGDLNRVAISRFEIGFWVKAQPKGNRAVPIARLIGHVLGRWVIDRLSVLLTELEGTSKTASSRNQLNVWMMQPRFCVFPLLVGTRCVYLLVALGKIGIRGLVEGSVECQRLTQANVRSSHLAKRNHRQAVHETDQLCSPHEASSLMDRSRGSPRTPGNTQQPLPLHLRPDTALNKGAAEHSCSSNHRLRSRPPPYPVSEPLLPTTR